MREVIKIEVLCVQITSKQNLNIRNQKLETKNMAIANKKTAKILVFSTEKISDPAIDMAGLLKLHYPPTVYTITVPCSSGIKPKWIMMLTKKDLTACL